jgi:hypothetical protein
MIRVLGRIAKESRMGSRDRLYYLATACRDIALMAADLRRHYRDEQPIPFGTRRIQPWAGPRTPRYVSANLAIR